jgi:hypothetical protein
LKDYYLISVFLIVALPKYADTIVTMVLILTCIVVSVIVMVVVSVQIYAECIYMVQASNLGCKKNFIFKVKVTPIFRSGGEYSQLLLTHQSMSSYIQQMRMPTVLTQKDLRMLLKVLTIMVEITFQQR